MKVFLMILAVVLPNGEIKITKQLMTECPSDLVVTAVMEPKIKSKEIIAWGGTCGPLPEMTGI